MEDPESYWEIECHGLPEERLYTYCGDAKELLERCGAILYGNTVFDVTFLRVWYRQDERPKDLSRDDDPAQRAGVEWIMRSENSEGSISYRQLENKHELFGMLIAEVRRGMKRVEAYRT